MKADLDLAKQSRARADAATPGEWRYDTYNNIVSDKREPWAIIAQILDHPQDDGPYRSEQIQERSEWYRESSDNAHFIAHARSDVPLLCDAIERLTKERDDAVAWDEKACNNFDEMAALAERLKSEVERLTKENAKVRDALDKVSMDWAEEMQARVSPPVSRTAAEQQELRDLRKENARLSAIEARGICFHGSVFCDTDGSAVCQYCGRVLHLQITTGTNSDPNEGTGSEATLSQEPSNG